MKPSTLSAEQVLELTRLHADLETRGELDALMKTLVDEPVFEFHPPGGSLSGGATLRGYYERFLADFMPRVEAAEQMGEWFDERAAVHEYRMRLKGDPQTHQLTSVLYVSGELLGGERIYGGEALLDAMLGSFRAQLVEIGG